MVIGAKLPIGADHQRWGVALQGGRYSASASPDRVLSPPPPPAPPQPWARPCTAPASKCASDGPYCPLDMRGPHVPRVQLSVSWGGGGDPSDFIRGGNGILQKETLIWAVLGTQPFGLLGSRTPLSFKKNCACPLSTQKPPSTHTPLSGRPLCPTSPTTAAVPNLPLTSEGDGLSVCSGCRPKSNSEAAGPCAPYPPPSPVFGSDAVPRRPHCTTEFVGPPAAPPPAPPPLTLRSVVSSGHRCGSTAWHCPPRPPYHSLPPASPVHYPPPQ